MSAPNRRNIAIIRIDPFRKTVARLLMRVSDRHSVREASRICRAPRVGHHHLLDVEGVPLMAAGGLDLDFDENMRGWRLKGSQSTAGYSFLFGRGPSGGMVPVPVDVDWVRQRIVWVEKEGE